MVRLVHIYETQAGLNEYLTQCNYNKDAFCFVRIFTSFLNPELAVPVAIEVKNLLPNATIVGASSSQAVLCNGTQHEHATMVIIETYQSFTMRVAEFSFENINAEELAQQIHRTFCPENEVDVPVVHILLSNPNFHEPKNKPSLDIECFIRKINSISPTLKLVGGIAGDLYEKGISGYLFNESGVLEYGIIAFAAYDSNVHHFLSVSNSMDVLSPIYEITEVEDAYISKIEGQPALDWMANYLELDRKQFVTYSTIEDTIKNDYLLHFPLVLEEENGSGRFTRYDEAHKNLGLYHATLQNHTKFRVGYVNPMKTVQEAQSTCEAILDIPVEYLSVYACLFRKLSLNNCAKWEIEPFRKHGICGAFLMGEIAFQNGKNIFHNGACVITGFAENEKYVLPDFHCLNHTDPLKDDLHFLQKAKEKGRAYLKSKNANLISMLEDTQQTKVQNTDEYTGLFNYHQFEEDNICEKYNKLTLIESLTADRSLATHGHQKFYSTIRDVVDTVKEFISQNNLKNSFNLYMLNYKTFIVASSASMSEEFFLECMRLFYQHFEYVSSKKTNISGVLRYVVVLNQKNPIEAGMNMLLANINKDNNFIVCDYDSHDTGSVSEESKVIDILNRAIQNKTITPFYQGLYNNKTGTIDKYEALMRVIDCTGKVHTPFSFMEVAKKYKYYNRISRMMIERVLQDFENRPQTVSINITLQDVQSESFKQWLFKKLQQYTHPEQLVFEFVETENYHAVEALLDFVKEIRTFGCKIAVDDFGSGYSTFSTIVALRPDYIKIDGSIIRGLLNNEESLIILNTIRYLAQQLKVNTVAEFVETQELQQVIELYDISYSQGYYFSKPDPIELLPQV